jgi:16S rRNA (cytosine1402-N4)-methyltransferase
MLHLHKTVLLHETINGLEIKNNDIVVDGTLGAGGHSQEILKRCPNVTLIAIDQDPDAILRSKKRLESFFTFSSKIIFVNDNFRNIDKVVNEKGLGSVDKIVLDLGWSSYQLEESERGFSFQKEEELLMTFKKEPLENELTAYDVVNTFEEENLADIIYGYGEERFSRRIAKGIVAARIISPIKTTKELANIIKNSVPFWYRNGRIHPATKTFQAIRITVNDELGALKEALTKGFNILKPEGRMAIITFHSLEDRIVKQYFKDKEKKELGRLHNKKPILPSKEELSENPRARSAKLRIIIKN